MKNCTEYKSSKEVQNVITKKMNELLELCQIYKLPMFVSVAIENNSENTVYKNCMFGGRVHEIILSDDQIQNHILVANGFKAVPPREEIIMDFQSNF